MSVIKIKDHVGGGLPPIKVGEPEPLVIPEGASLLFENTEYSFDKDGNALDKENKVFKTVDELKTLLKDHPEYIKPKVTETPEEKLAREERERVAALVVEDPFKEGNVVELDDVSYTIDKDGNAVDATGKIVKTKAELKTLYDAIKVASDNTPDYIKEIQTKTNLVINNEQGQPVAYENTVEGLTQYAKDIYETGIKIGSEQTEEQLFSSYPILKDVLVHLQLNGGSLKNFNEEPDYNKITLDDNNFDQLTSVYVMAQVKRGIPEAEAIATAKYLKDDKKLPEFAKSGLAFLIQNKTTEDQQKQALLQQQVDAEEAINATYWNNINNSIKNKQIKLDGEEITIPDVIRVKTAEGKVETKTLNDFVKYITEPRNFNIDGRVVTATQNDFDLTMEQRKRTPDNDLFDAYRRFTKYDDTQLIKAKIRNERAKETIKLSTKPGTGGGSSIETKGVKLKLPV
jgi:hypothetical protein